MGFNKVLEENSMNKDILKQIKFGTDGWRAVISDTFTFENVGIVAQAISDWIKTAPEFKNKKKQIAVGYDTRFLSENYAELMSCVFAKNGIKVFLSEEAIPTPSLSYGVVCKKCVAGVMITASHNPGSFNGIKIKTSLGGGASVDITNKVESLLTKNSVKTMDYAEALKKKQIVVTDFMTDHVKFIKNYINFDKIKNSNFKIIVDVMHGSGFRLVKEVLKGTKIKLTMFRDERNPWFDGSKPEPVEDYLGKLKAVMKKEKFDLGLIFDGDADRIAAMAPGGIFINPQKILALLTLHLVRNQGRTGGAVKTTCGSAIMDGICKKLDMKLYETPVGFKYISDLMINERIVVGGEEAGGMGVQDFVPERDGTLAGLLLLEMMVYNKKDIKQIVDDMEKEFGRYFYVRSDIALGKKKADLKKFLKTKTLLGKKVVDFQDYDGAKLICEDQSWLMVRPSGTEPLVRAYAEAKSLKKANELLSLGEKLLK